MGKFFHTLQPIQVLWKYFYSTCRIGTGRLDGCGFFFLEWGMDDPNCIKFIIHSMKMVNQKHNIVGFDVVELCPNKIDKAPDFLASKLVYKILSYKFNK